MNFGTYSFPKRSFPAPEALPDGTLRVQLLQQAQAGDLIYTDSYGFKPLYWAAGSTNISTTAAGTALQGSITNVTTATLSANGGMKALALSTGDTIVVFHNGTSSLQFARYDSSGTLQGSITTVASVDVTVYSSGNRFNIVELVSGDFVIAYCNSTTNVSFARYNSSGVIQGSVTIVEAVSAQAGVVIEALATGEFIVAYSNSTSSIKFGRYSSSGVLQGSLTTVEAVAGLVNLAITELLTGDFVITYSTTGTPYIKFTRYNSSGVIQGANTLVESNTSNYGLSIHTLTTGDFIIVNSRTSQTQFTRYNSSGTIQGSITTVEAASSGSNLSHSAVVLTSGDFIVFYGNSTTNVKFGRYNSSGVLQGALTVVETINASNGLAAFELSSGDFLTVYTNSTSSIKFSRFSSTGVAIGSATTIDSLTVISSSIVAANNATSGEIFLCYGSSTTPKFARYTGAAPNIIGVATHSAAAGAYVNVTTCGPYGRPISYKLRNDWGSLKAIDHSSAGYIKVNVVGSSAFLRGF